MPHPYNPAPYGAPYSNPYVDRYNAITAQNFAGAAQSYGGQITRVNGRNGAESFRMAPNASVLLMDENDPIMWLKVSDGAGYCTLTPYSISRYQAAALSKIAPLYCAVLYKQLSGKTAQTHPEPLTVSGDSEFLAAVADKNSVEIFAVMDELMESVRAICPRLYEATMRKLESIE